jgi:nitrate reductase NapE component
MNIETLQIFLAAAVILAALSVAVVCAVGVVVWLAGGKLDHGKWHRLA